MTLIFQYRLDVSPQNWGSTHTPPRIICTSRLLLQDDEEVFPLQDSESEATELVCWVSARLSDLLTYLVLDLLSYACDTP